MANTLTVCRASAGTGKTYTLAARYIALLMDDEGYYLYRHILAVTFTNKATAEMKQRILSYLFMIAEGDANDNGRKGFIKAVRGYMSRQDLSDHQLKDKAERIYHNILDDYNNMKVSTIDSFLQTLITGMAHMLGIGAGFSVVLNQKHVISTAVDQVMTTHINETEETKEMLVEYVEEQLDEEKRWDIRKQIISMATEVMKESVLKDDQDIILDANTISAYRKSLRKKYFPEISPFKAKCQQVSQMVEHKDIIDHKNINAFLKRVISIARSISMRNKDLQALGKRDLKSLQSADFYKKVPCQTPSGQAAIDAHKLQELLLEINDLMPSIRAKHLLYSITVEYLNDLRLMGVVKTRIDNSLNDTNSILLARTAYVLYKSLKPGDADFILEKAGIRYKHIMIDEFQDTSTLQWQIFLGLVREVLSNGGTTLIVGDVKQSIYRWRNGDYSIMADMNQNTPLIGTYYDTATTPLTRNYRSQSNVVHFNLSIFKSLIEPSQVAESLAHLYREGKDGYSADNLRAFHSKSHDNGYVQFRVFPFRSGKPGKNTTEGQLQLNTDKAKTDLVDSMFNDISNLLNNGASPTDMLILIRKGKEIEDIISGYQRSNLKERGINICSNDSFVLESSDSVLAIISCLKYLHSKDQIAYEQLKIKNINTAPLYNFDTSMPLYELTENIIHEILCDDEGRFRYDDIPFVNCFVDSLRNYVDAYGSDIKAFITYWNDELRSKAIPASGNEGIRIMTIHSSKGLESKHLFIPFCNWPLCTTGDTLWVKAHGETHRDDNVADLGLIPTSFCTEMSETPYEPDYQKERDAQLIDNLNLLYVALTRAADNLFIYAPLHKSTLDIDSNTKQIKIPTNVGACLLYTLRDEKVADGSTLKESFSAVYEQCEEGQPAYTQYTVGNEPYIETSQQEKENTPFEYHYSEAEKCSYDFYSTNKNIAFRQSQESMLYSQEEADKAESIQQRINAGILRHNILSEIKTTADTDKVVNKYFTKGLIETRAQADAIKAELTRAWQIPEMHDWFGGSWQLLREVTILVPASQERGKKELRPDRVMIKNGKAVVLDYKFGKHNHDKYSTQVKEYMDVLRNMGYTDVAGYLWYGFDNELVKI